MTDLAAIREHIESLAEQAKGYRPTGTDDGLNIIRLIALCDAIDELAALLADTPSVEPLDVERLTRAVQTWWAEVEAGARRSGGDLHGISVSNPKAAAVLIAAKYAALPTQASDSPEKP